MAATKMNLKQRLIRYGKGAVLFCLATFSMVGYQNCMGQKVDLLSTTPGASEAVACSPSTTELSEFTSANTDMQNTCIMCHGDLNNTASSVMRLYDTSGDATLASGNLCAVQSRTTSAFYTKITSQHSSLPINSSNAANLLNYLQTH